ncbi:MAG: hypothetical protein JNN20_08170 [Betaproteobacteria bacterium]|nr:hypothetical protein [Betaproteobacteria bacterium]
MSGDSKVSGSHPGTTAMMFFRMGIGSMLTALSLWYLAGARDFFHALEETRMANGMITQKEVPVAPQLREYLKGRVYWNAAVWIPKGWLFGANIDHGPIDEKVLGDVGIAKDGTPALDVYLHAIKKHQSGK